MTAFASGRFRFRWLWTRPLERPPTPVELEAYSCSTRSDYIPGADLKMNKAPEGALAARAGADLRLFGFTRPDVSGEPTRLGVSHPNRCNQGNIRRCFLRHQPPGAFLPWKAYHGPTRLDNSGDNARVDPPAKEHPPPERSVAVINNVPIVLAVAFVFAHQDRVAFTQKTGLFTSYRVVGIAHRADARGGQRRAPGARPQH